MTVRPCRDDYLVKPVNKAALLKVFHQLLERKARLASPRSPLTSLTPSLSLLLAQLVPPQKQKPDKRATILLAEDNPVAANVASVVLRQHYHVDVAPHG